MNFWTHTRMDSILFGAILALWNNPVLDREDRLPGRWNGYIIGGGLLAISFLVRDEVFRQTLRYTVQGVGLIFVFNAAIRDERLAHPLLENAPLRLIAALSYMLYLVHGIFVQATEPLASQIGRPAAATAGLGLAFGFAYATRVFMEEPLARWRKQVERRWRRERAQENGVVAAPPPALVELPSNSEASTEGPDGESSTEEQAPAHSTRMN